MSPRFSFPTATELRVYLIQSAYGLDHRRFITDEKAGLVVVDELSAGALAEGDDRGAIDHRFDHHHPEWFRPAGSASAASQRRLAEPSSRLLPSSPTKRTDPLDGAVSVRALTVASRFRRSTVTSSAFGFTSRRSRRRWRLRTSHRMYGAAWDSSTRTPPAPGPQHGPANQNAATASRRRSSRRARRRGRSTVTLRGERGWGALAALPRAQRDLLALILARDAHLPPSRLPRGACRAHRRENEADHAAHGSRRGGTTTAPPAALVASRAAAPAFSLGSRRRSAS